MKHFKHYLCIGFIVNPPSFFLSVIIHFALTFRAQGPFLPCAIVSTPADRNKDLSTPFIFTDSLFLWNLCPYFTFVV